MVVQNEISIQERSINQKSSDTMPVMLCAGATLWSHISVPPPLIFVQKIFQPPALISTLPPPRLLSFLLCEGNS